MPEKLSLVQQVQRHRRSLKSFNRKFYPDVTSPFDLSETYIIDLQGERKDVRFELTPPAYLTLLEFGYTTGNPELSYTYSTIDVQELIFTCGVYQESKLISPLIRIPLENLPYLSQHERMLLAAL